VVPHPKGKPPRVLPSCRKGNAAGWVLSAAGEAPSAVASAAAGGHRSCGPSGCRRLSWRSSSNMVLGAVLRGSPWRNFGGAAVGPAAAALARCWGRQARVGEGQGAGGARVMGWGPATWWGGGKAWLAVGGGGRGVPGAPQGRGTLDQGLEDGLSHGGAMAPSGAMAGGSASDQSRELPRPFFARKTAPGSSAARECSTGAPAGSAGAQGGGRVPAAASVAARRRTARRARSAAARRADVLFF